jgi:hypothetical protein
MSGAPDPPSAPYVEVMHMVRGFMLTQAVHVGAKLALFDIMAEEPRTAEEIALAVRADARALARLLRFLTAVGLLREDEGHRFSSTALGKVLESSHPQSARPLAIMYGEAFFWRPWGELYEAVKAGTSSFERLYGETFFQHLASHPVPSAIFNAAMTSASRFDVPAILAAYDFSSLRRIVDVAGGQGALLRGILQQYPAIHGVLCDLPAVVSDLLALELTDVHRLSVVAGDMFEGVPLGADAYILKRVLHDWEDAKALQLLRNVRRAIVATGKLLVIDAVVRPSNEPDPAKWMDLNMLAVFPGRERTEEEFRSLYDKAGFRLTRIVPAMALSVIEGIPA